jgi:hypothetical protein
MITLWLKFSFAPLGLCAWPMWAVHHPTSFTVDGERRACCIKSCFKQRDDFPKGVPSRSYWGEEPVVDILMF